MQSHLDRISHRSRVSPAHNALAATTTVNRTRKDYPQTVAVRETMASTSAIGTSELPSCAVVRLLLFPFNAVFSLWVSTLFYSQPITRPYVILAVLSFALSWQLFDIAEVREPGPLGRLGYFMPRVLFGWAKILSVLLFLAFAAKTSAAYSRAVIITWAIVTPLLYSAMRVVAYRILCRWNRRGRIPRKHVIVGTTHVARDMASRIERDASLGTFIGFFDEAANKGCDVIGDLDSLPDYVRRNCIDVVHIAWPLNRQLVSDMKLNRLLERLRDTTVSIYFLLDVPRHDYSSGRMVEMAGMPLLTYFETPYCGLHGLTKRLFDIVIAAIALVLLWPVLLIIALLIRLDSPGPIVFKQRRYGLNGEEFAVYKFRTMTVCEDGAAIAQATREDARITRVGKLLRKTSLDELPQLLCVLTGSMSVVGPRPHAIAHNEQYRRLIDGYMLRHKVRPGITGWAQVNGLRGETRTVDQMRARVLYDLEYLRHWSPWVDIKILFRTALLVVRDRNAY